MIRFVRTWRAWFEIEDPSLLVPAYAKQKTIKIDGDHRIRFELRRCPERNSVLNGVRFAVQDGMQFVGNFECAMTSRSGVLEMTGGGQICTIDETDLEQGDVAAYYFPNSSNSQPVTLSIVPQVSGANQVKIEPGGRIEASSNLVGKLIKVRLVYPRVVVQTDQAIESAKVHLVGLWEDSTVRYVTVPGASFDVKGRSLIFGYKPQQITCHKLL